jgi:hypothetical protein
MAKWKVKCTAPWWHRETYFAAGSEVDVSEGTPVPQGFLVNGVEVPKAPKVPMSKIIEIEELQDKSLQQEAEILKLRRELEKATKPTAKVAEKEKSDGR